MADDTSTSTSTSTSGTGTGRKSLRRRLGRGLGSLISAPVQIDKDAGEKSAETPRAAPASEAELKPHDFPAARSTATADDPSPPRTGDEIDRPSDVSSHLIEHVPVEAISPNPRQPRRHFDDGGLDSLAASIRQTGLMQPVVLRPREDGRYELVAGERRWRAAERAGLSQIPALVRTLDDRQQAEWSLIENLQREDLNPIEKAEAFARLHREFGLTHQEIAREVGLDRTSVTNLIRLIELDAPTRELVERGALGLGHARALLAVPRETDRVRLAQAAVSEEWSVREIERRIRLLNQSPADSSKAPPREGDSSNRDSGRTHLNDLEEKLRRYLGTRVRIRTGRRKGTGRLIIDFFSLDEFDGLMKKIGFEDIS